MARTLIASVRTGARHLNGADWPITDQLERVNLRGRRPEWVITRGLCNGTPDGAIEYRKLRLALAEWSRLGHSADYVRAHYPRRTRCEDCRGTGQVACHASGMGERRRRCESCSGSGYMRLSAAA